MGIVILICTILQVLDKHNDSTELVLNKHWLSFSPLLLPFAFSNLSVFLGALTCFPVSLLESWAEVAQWRDCE